MKYSVILAITTHISVLTISASPLVTNSTNGVSYKGTSASGIEQFQNIFFAQSTAGERRFAPPQPYVPPDGTTIVASTPGAACPQMVTDNEFFSAVTNISEDCLSLRIARPAGTLSSDRLPVMVWIYGGGDTFGQIYDSLYTPTGLVLQAVSNGQPVIYVAINYRLNIFGFASSDALRASRSLNVGLKDQRLGIQWVKDNIAAFGGDPNNITIFGESDGATGIGLQLTAYGGKYEAPFHQVIMQSGAPVTDAGVSSNFSATSYAAVAALTNCTHSSPGSNETLTCLRKLSMETLLHVAVGYAHTTSPPSGFDVFFPVIDNDFIPAAPSELVRTGRFSKGISIITGWAADDGSILTPSTIANESAVAAFLSASYPGLMNSTITEILAMYPVSDFEFQVSPNDTVNAQYYRASRIYRDSKFTCPSIDISYNIMKYSNAHAWLYELNQTVFASYFSSIGSPYLGIGHLSDVPYVFNRAAAFNGSSSDTLLAAQMSGNWSAFAATGTPTKATTWPVAYADSTSATPNKAIINVLGGPYAGPAQINVDNFEGPVGMEKLLVRCAFFNRIYRQLRT